MSTGQPFVFVRTTCFQTILTIILFFIGFIFILFFDFFMVRSLLLAFASTVVDGELSYFSNFHSFCITEWFEVQMFFFFQIMKLPVWGINNGLNLINFSRLASPPHPPWESKTIWGQNCCAGCELTCLHAQQVVPPFRFWFPGGVRGGSQLWKRLALY